MINGALRTGTQCSASVGRLFLPDEMGEYAAARSAVRPLAVSFYRTRWASVPLHAVQCVRGPSVFPGRDGRVCRCTQCSASVGRLFLPDEMSECAAARSAVPPWAFSFYRTRWVSVPPHAVQRGRGPPRSSDERDSCRTRLVSTVLHGVQCIRAPSLFAGGDG